MKRPKFNFPKLKNPTLYSIVMYLPAFSFFFVLLILALFTDTLLGFFGDDGFAAVLIISLLVSAAASLWYLLHDHFRFIMLDALFDTVRAWKRDRKWFETNRNGSGKAEAAEKISRRMALLGYTCAPVGASPAPLLIKYYSHFSWTVFYARVEKICLLYSVEHLDIKLYNQIITSVKANTVHLHGDKEKMFFLDKSKKKAPIACATAAIILADSVDEKIPAAVRRNIGSFNENVILPCVADFSEGKYYFDSMSEVYMLGVMGRPMKNHAIDIIKKAVFGGRLPLRGNEHFTEWHGDDLNTSFPELMKSVSGTLHPHKIPLRYKLAARSIKPGQVKFIGSFIFCKIRRKTIAFPYTVDKEDPRRLHVTFHKQSYSDFGRNLSKKEAETLRAQLLAFLEAEGFSAELTENQNGKK